MGKDLELVRKCLTLISRIAARGASSPDPAHVRDTLMELTYALERESDWTQPLAARVRPSSGRDLERLHGELDFIDATSQPLAANLILKCASRSTWN
jgi:hypothetical protein